MQELGFFSWYFNKLGVASYGTGGGILKYRKVRRALESVSPRRDLLAAVRQNGWP